MSPHSTERSLPDTQLQLMPMPGQPWRGSYPPGPKSHVRTTTSSQMSQSPGNLRNPGRHQILPPRVVENRTRPSSRRQRWILLGLLNQKRPLLSRLHDWYRRVRLRRRRQPSALSKMCSVHRGAAPLPELLLVSRIVSRVEGASRLRSGFCNQLADHDVQCLGRRMHLTAQRRLRSRRGMATKRRRRETRTSGREVPLSRHGPARALLAHSQSPTQRPHLDHALRRVHPLIIVNFGRPRSNAIRQNKGGMSLSMPHT